MEKVEKLVSSMSGGEVGEEESNKARGRERVLGAMLDVVAQEAASGSGICADTCMMTESRQCP